MEQGLHHWQAALQRQVQVSHWLWAFWRLGFQTPSGVSSWRRHQSASGRSPAISKGEHLKPHSICSRWKRAAPIIVSTAFIQGFYLLWSSSLFMPVIDFVCILWPLSVFSGSCAVPHAIFPCAQKASSLSLLRIYHHFRRS